MVDKWTIIHQFILSDNRHYVFYIYRYFYWLRYPLCLVYPFCIIILLRVIVSSNGKLVKFLVWGVAAMMYLGLS